MFRGGSPASGNAAITSGTGVPIKLSKSGVPFIWLSSGSMGNNGALTGVTALPDTFDGGAWVLLPAGAIAAGIPAAAAWYWCVFSSTTAGTVFNSIYTSGEPVAGTQTAFVTTGPGAFTGVIADTTGPSITLPANSLGVGGMQHTITNWAFTNNANSKTMNFKFGSLAVLSSALNAHIDLFVNSYVWNRGVTNRQTAINHGLTQSGALVGALEGIASIDTTAAVTLALTSTRATATDNVVLLSHAMTFLA